MLSVRFFGYRYLGDGGTDRSKILNDSTYVSRMCLLPFGGGSEVSPGIPQIRNLPTPVWRVLYFANALVRLFVSYSK